MNQGFGGDPKVYQDIMCASFCREPKLSVMMGTWLTKAPVALEESESFVKMSTTTHLGALIGVNDPYTESPFLSPFTLSKMDPATKKIGPSIA